MSFDPQYVPPDWARSLLFFNDVEGGFASYYDVVYREFRKDWVGKEVCFGSLPVKVRSHDGYAGKHLFDHIVYGDKKGRITKPDFRRFERIRWIKDIIENYTDDHVKYWESDRNKHHKMRIHLWLDEEFLVVLERTSSGFQLITAFPTDYSKVRELYTKEYEEFCANK